MVQPVLWLTTFGQVFARTRAILTGGILYLDLMAPGILAQSVLFGAIFSVYRSSENATWESCTSFW